MWCDSCNTVNSADRYKCRNCGALLARPENEEQLEPADQKPARNIESFGYAGFLPRSIAALIDIPIAAVFGFAVCILLSIFVIPFRYLDPKKGANTFLIMNLIGHSAAWLYYAVLECSEFQGTFGKKLLGLKVTDLEGAPLSFWRSSARYFGHYLSFATLGLGFLMAFFSDRNQALHDRLAGCLIWGKSESFSAQ
jgi:uncharacterized RDD family membrane protein YckC